MPSLYAHPSCASNLCDGWPHPQFSRSGGDQLLVDGLRSVQLASSSLGKPLRTFVMTPLVSAHPTRLMPSVLGVPPNMAEQAYWKAQKTVARFTVPLQT